jgi:hypothetical protein
MVFHPKADDAIVVDPFLLAFCRRHSVFGRHPERIVSFGMVFHPTADAAIAVDPFLLAFCRRHSVFGRHPERIVSFGMVFHATADGAIVVDPFLLAFLPGAIPFLAVIQRDRFVRDGFSPDG